MNIKNLKVSKNLMALTLAGTMLTLTGCNYTLFDTKYSFNKALIFDEDTVTIVEIEKWTDYDGEQLQLQTEDGLILLTSSIDTKLVNDKNSDITAEDIARSIKGEDVQINYLEEVAEQRTR